MNNKYAITGIILSGGKSLRMGKNKAFIEIDGIPIIKRIYSLFEKYFSEIIIVTNQKKLFIELNVKIFNDIIPDKGVLGGLYSGLFFSTFHYSFCVACDMPFLKESLIQYMVDHIKDEDAIVPRTNDGLQPLHAIYSKNCLHPIRDIIKQGKYKVVDIYSMVKTKIIEEKEIIPFDPLKESFINVNTPEELSLINKWRGSIKGV